MPKRIVICADGTWNTPDQVDRGQVRPSNVAKTALALLERDSQGIGQCLFYGKGVGTRWRERLRGGAFGWGLSRNIQEAYRFLIENYEPGDDLYLFGFSRGAYTVRSLAGLIRKTGILRMQHRDRLPEAYDLYRRRDLGSRPSELEPQLFRKAYSHEVRIKFIGVWDTVGALGIPLSGLRIFHCLNWRWRFHDAELGSHVDHAYQALAIDEKRGPFKPTLWEQKTEAVGQVLEQVWFAGVHTNIGGGNADTGLSDHAFLWMMDKAAACGLEFDPRYIQDNIKANALGELRNSRTGIYRVLLPFNRPIGGGRKSHEAVHQSALDRKLNFHDPDYAPKKLLDYLEAGGPVAALSE